MKPVLPHKINPIVRNDGISEQTMRAWMESITENIELLEIMEGDGSPEGVIYASKKKQYYDNSGSSGSRLYIKTTARNLNTGWEVIG